MLINLTPHPIVIGDRVFPPSGTIARVATTETVAGTCPVTGVPIVTRSFGAVTGLPADGTPCLVSALVLSAVPGRPHTYAPDTGPTAIRDAAGNIVAVTRIVAA